MSEGKKILIVDDDLYMRVFLSTALETSGYCPVSCKDGKEGMEKAGEVRPSLIVLDIMMPNQGGVLMYRELRTDEILKRIPVIMLSGVEEKVFRHSMNMLDAGSGLALPEPEGYLEKPPRAEEFLGLVQTLLSEKG
ncbi:MAG: response regulator [Desulfobacteraceae bacterium]|nr:MAG: response regulator [Desulfobacteraceae bacterium]